MLKNQVMAEPLSSNQIHKIALNIRTLVGLQQSLYFPILEFVESVLPQIDPNFNFCIEERRNMTDKYAYYDHTKNEMVVRDDVYDMAYANDGRHRFTIAHELGHYILHRNGTKMCRISGNERIAVYLDPEWQANTFASAILMPRHLIDGMTAHEISRYCGTSAQAADIAYKKAKKPS